MIDSTPPGLGNAGRAPPLVRGLPLVGSLLDYRRDHLGVFRRAYEDHGPVFAIRLGPQQGVVLIGPRYHEFFFREVDRRLSVPELYRFVVPMFGEVLLAARDRDTRRRQVALMQSAFQGGQLAGYAEVMVAETKTWLDTFGDSATFDAWEALEGLSMNVAASALMGPEVRERVGEFRPLLDDLARGMDFVLPPNLPLPKFRRRDRARQLLTEMLEPVLAARRRRPGGRGDFLQKLVDHPELHGGNELLAGMALCTIFTGYITTAAQMAWALILLLQHPGYLESVRAELAHERVRLPEADFPLGARLPRLEWAVKEAVRLRPVMSHFARTTAEEYTLEGWRVPKGWLTILCPAVAHRLPEVFTDPERYDPERFGPARAEDKRHHYALIGFSGGFYRCPGSAFGLTEIKVMLSMLLDRGSVALRTPDPATAFDLGIVRPASPCWLHYVRAS